MTINITCTSSYTWKNIYSNHKHNNILCFKDRPYWETLDSGSSALSKTIRVSHDGLSISEVISCDILGLFAECRGWAGLPVKVSKEDTRDKLIDDIAKYVLHLTDNYLN